MRQCMLGCTHFDSTWQQCSLLMASISSLEKHLQQQQRGKV
jgi:hypothetical protein